MKGWQRPELESSFHVLFAVGSHALPLVTERSWQRLNDYVWTQNSLRSSSQPGVSVRCGSIPMTRCRPSRVSCLAAFGLNGRAACGGTQVSCRQHVHHVSHILIRVRLNGQQVSAFRPARGPRQPGSRPQASHRPHDRDRSRVDPSGSTPSRRSWIGVDRVRCRCHCG